jgi:hypothetical protein
MAVARQRLSRPSRRTATARVRARPRTITTASTAPSRGSHRRIEPIVKLGLVMGCPLARRARADKTVRLRRCRYTSSVTQRAICSRSRAPARTSITQRVRFSTRGAGSGSSALGVGWCPKNSSGTKRGRIILDGSVPVRCRVGGEMLALGEDFRSGSVLMISRLTGRDGFVHPH